MLSFAAALVACGGDEVVTLGYGDPAPAFGDAGRRVRNVNEVASGEYGATLTDDLLEVFFISDRSGGLGGADVWRATRSSRVDAFGLPEIVLEVSSPADEASPAISGDGLTLWIASRREHGQGGMDIWRATRPERSSPWGPLENATALNGPLDDLPRPPGRGGERLPITSNRSGDVYQTFLASRVDGEFAAPEPVSELWETERSMEEAFLTSDGLFLFFRRAPPGQPGDLFVSWRDAAHDPFGEPLLLASVSSDADERDPFISGDRIRFFFSSDRRDGGALDIYATSLTLPALE